MENSNCCTPNQNNNTNCCPPSTPPVEEKKGGLKKGLGLIILGLALVFAVSSAFRTASNTNEIGVSPPSIEDFEWMETDKEAAYVLVKGEEEEQNKQLSTKITEVVLELNGTDGSAEYFELYSSLEHYKNFVETTGVEETPVVVVVGRIGNLSLVDSESVSSIKLYKAYVAATTPPASCNPAACAPSKSCKPSKDCKPSISCTPAQRAKCAAKNNN